jgi:hypothetical protein
MEPSLASPPETEAIMEQLDARGLAAAHPIQVVIPPEWRWTSTRCSKCSAACSNYSTTPGCYSGADIRFVLESRSPGSSACSASIPTHTQVLSNLS